MKNPSFRKILFRLFLLFALVPALILTLVGYFLISETGVIEEVQRPTSTSQLVEYYNDLFYDRIEGSLDEYVKTGMVPDAYPDFLFIKSDDSLKAIKRPDLLTDDLLNNIIKAGDERTRGFIEGDNRYYQFVKIPVNSHTMLYGGIVHGPSYREIIGNLHSDRATQAAEKKLKSEYIFFQTSFLIVLAIIMIIAAYFLSVKIAGNLSRPLIELSAASRKIAEGDFDQMIKPQGEGEIAQLVDSFNYMAEQLDRTTTRLTQTERVAAWRQIARRFAHELKNPLQPILISLYRIEKQLLDTPSYDKIYEPLKAASDELKHLTSLAERFSHLAKLPPPKKEEIDLKELILSVTALYEDRLKEYDFKLNLPEEIPVCRVDAAYLREALHNLIQNAMDASEKNGLIEVELSFNRSHIHISVIDNGTGMSTETAASARLPYFTTKEQGTGLGLAIVEKSVNELNGELTIKSTKGLGTRVTISLPCEN